jgi:hypothetical protein
VGQGLEVARRAGRRPRPDLTCPARAILARGEILTRGLPRLATEAGLERIAVAWYSTSHATRGDTNGRRNRAAHRPWWVNGVSSLALSR